MKLLHVTTAYPAYLAEFYARRAGLARETYASQQAQLFVDSFAVADFWTHALTARSYECADIIYNAEPMQQAWWRERYGEEKIPNLEEIVVRQARAFLPEILLFDDVSASLLRRLREELPGLRLVLGWTGSALPADLGVFRSVDLVMSCAQESVIRLRTQGFAAEQVHHAFDPRILDRLGPAQAPEHPISFIGQLIRGSEFHHERLRLLEQVAEATDLSIFSESARLGYAEDFKALAKAAAYGTYRAGDALGLRAVVDRLPLVKNMKGRREVPVSQRHPRLAPYLRPACYGLEMYRTIRASQVFLNAHADSSPRFASNMRLFEATGVGSCLLTDWRENLSELFHLDDEIVTYRSAAECAEKARWLIDHPKDAARISLAGQKRTLAEHHYSSRAARIDSLIHDKLK